MKFRFRDWLTHGFRGIHLKETVWNDLSIPLTPGLRGALAKPDYDYANLGLLFPQNDVAEIAYATRQMSHAKKLESPIYLHIHYIQSAAQQPIFKVDYKFYNNGEEVPAGWTTVSTELTKGVFPYTSGSLLQIARFPLIQPPTNENVSANLDIKLYRDDNDVVGDVLTKYVDIHYEIDSIGSAGEFTKWTEA